MTDHQHRKESRKSRSCQEQAKKFLLNLGEKAFLAAVIAHQVARTTVGIAVLTAMYPVLFMPKSSKREGTSNGKSSPE